MRRRSRRHQRQSDVIFPRRIQADSIDRKIPGDSDKGRREYRSRDPRPSRPGSCSGAVVVVESMAAITAMDMLLMSMTSRLDLIQMFFQVENVDDSPEQ